MTSSEVVCTRHHIRRFLRRSLVLKIKPNTGQTLGTTDKIDRRRNMAKSEGRALLTIDLNGKEHVLHYGLFQTSRKISMLQSEFGPSDLAIFFLLSILSKLPSVWPVYGFIFVRVAKRLACVRFYFQYQGST